MRLNPDAKQAKKDKSMTAKTKGKVTILTGNQAIAEAMRQINPDVVAVYPITPQTDVAERLSSFVADGLLDAEYVPVESEHSAMSACVGAAAAGARAITATASQGLVYMQEVMYIASGLRLPIVMANVNRSLSAPINIHCDHSDSMGARDSGWIQLYSENAQEAYDNIIQAVRIAEHQDVRLPVMVNMDGFIVSHGTEVLELLDDKDVSEFVGEYEPVFSLLDIERPVAIGPFDGLHGHFFEHKMAQVKAMDKARKVTLDVGKEFASLTGRDYGFFEEYRLADAEVAVVVLASAAGTCKIVVDELREQGLPVGLLKLRVFRPFPSAELVGALRHVKVIGVLDRSVSPGLDGGPVFAELRSSFYDMETLPKVMSFIYGLGGREFKPQHASEVFSSLLSSSKTGYLGIRLR